jgi:hypothetical protein
VELRFTGRAEDAVVADLRGAPRQDVLKKAMDELDAGKRDVTNLLSAIVAIAKTNFAIRNGFQPAVGNGDTENVTSKVVEDLVATAGMLRMDDPFFSATWDRSDSDRSGRKHFLLAVIALIDMSSKERRAASGNILQSAFLNRTQSFAIFFAVRRAVEADDIGHLQHEDLEVRGPS